MDERPRRRRKKSAGTPVSGLITAVLIVSVVVVLGLMIWVFSGDRGVSASSAHTSREPVEHGDMMSSSVAMDRRTAIAVKQMAASIATDSN